MNNNSELYDRSQKSVKDTVKAAKATKRGAKKTISAVKAVKNGDAIKKIKELFLKVKKVLLVLMSPYTLLIATAIILLAMFFNMLTNDVFKQNGPMAQNSWIYKANESDPEIQAYVKSKTTSNSSLTYTISHNAEHQRGLDKPLSEDSEELKKTVGYTDEIVKIYAEPSLATDKKFVLFKYGDTVQAYDPDNSGKEIRENGFLAIEISEETRDFDGIVNSNGEGFGSVAPYLSGKKYAYIEERLVYKREVHDFNYQYSLKDEYELMALSLRKVLDKQKQSEVNKGNKMITDLASKYSEGTSVDSYFSDERYEKLNAAIVYENGQIVNDISIVKNPSVETFDAASSRATLNGSTASLRTTHQDTAKMLSGYAASKGDSIPDKNYYKVLDTEIHKFLKNSLKLRTPDLFSTTKTRSIPTKTIQDLYSLSFIDSANTKGILMEYNGDLPNNLTRYDMKGTGGNIVMVDPESQGSNKNDIEKINGRYFREQDIKTFSGRYLEPAINGQFIILPLDDYMKLNNVPETARGEVERNAVRDYGDIIAKTKQIKVLPKKQEVKEYSYQEWKAYYTISPLNAEHVIWSFFTNADPTYFPEVKPNNTVQTANDLEVSFGQFDNASWINNYKKLRSLVFYNQELVYMFNNESLLNNPRYFSMPNPDYDPAEANSKYNKYLYFTMKKEKPTSQLEKIYINEWRGMSGQNIEDLKEEIKDTKDLAGTLADIYVAGRRQVNNVSDIEFDSSGYATNYKKDFVQNFGYTPVNNAGIEAVRDRIFYIFPSSFKQVYRRKNEPTMIDSSLIDTNGNYIKTYKDVIVTSNGSTPIMGSSIDPVDDWRSKVTSEYGPRENPTNPGAGTEFHYGLDIAGPIGTPMRAMFDGVVAFSGVSGGYGNLIAVDGNNGYGTRYGHADQLLLKVGDPVKAGQVIAYMGTTGRSTGPHLHLEVRIGNWQGETINPRAFLEGLSGSVAPTAPQTVTVTEVNQGTQTPMNEQVGKLIKQSIGNKMDYWYDNLMLYLSEKDVATNAQYNSGQSVVDLAMTYLGDVGGKYFKSEMSGKNINEVDVLTPGNTFDWCGAFVSVIMRDAGFEGYKGDLNAIGKDNVGKTDALAPYSLRVKSFIQWGENTGTIHEDDKTYIPKPGDLVIYGDYHVEFVHSVNESGYKTIGGNTIGEGAGTLDGPDWKGVVNTFEHPFNHPTRRMRFIDIKYPQTNTFDNVALENVKKVIGSKVTTIDKYGRIGIGLWFEDDARELLRRIQKASGKEFDAIISSSEYGKDTLDYIEGRKQMSKEMKSTITSILALKPSEKIQEKFMLEKIGDITKTAEKAYGKNWQFLDAKSRLYLTISQLVFNSYGEKQWITSGGVSNIVNNAINNKLNFQALVAAFESFGKTLDSRPDSRFFNKTYDNIAMVKTMDGDVVSLWFMKQAKRPFLSASTTINAIPDSQITFGLGNGKTWTLPGGLGKTKSYMGNHMITATSTEQYRLKQFTTTGPHGVGIIDGRMTVAMYAAAKGSAPKGYGNVGDMIDVMLEDGTILHLVIADAKNIEDDFRNYPVYHSFTLDYVKQWGIHNEGSIIEFVLNTQIEDRYPTTRPSFTNIYPGAIKTIVNLGPVNK